MGGLVSVNNSMFRGKLLIAHPNIVGSIFSKSVIYMYQDAPNSTCGVLLNKLSDWDIPYMFDYKGYSYISSDFVHLGGPVNTSAITLLHSDEFYSSNTLNISRGISISSDNFMFEKIAEGNEPEDWKLLIGVCNWYDGQLEKEIDNKYWLTMDATPELVFSYEGDEQWEKAIEAYGQTMVDSFFAFS